MMDIPPSFDMWAINTENGFTKGNCYIEEEINAEPDNINEVNVDEN